MLLRKVFNRRLSLVLGESCTIVVFFKRMADSSESERENYNIFSSTDEEDLFRTIGRRFQPYQDKPLASSDSEGDGPTSDGNDDPEDEDGIWMSQFRDREAGSVSVDHW